jgi:peptidoglycan/xylan/chitin deacetylase (PgdA/CDA1 family)
MAPAHHHRQGGPLSRRQVLGAASGISLAVIATVTGLELSGRSSSRTKAPGSKAASATTPTATTPAAGHAAPTTTVPATTTTAPPTTTTTEPPTTAEPPTTTTTEQPVSGPLSEIQWFGPATDKRVYLTVDDGWFPSQRVLELMRAEHIPVTAFLIANAAEEHLDYWKAFLAAGGRIQNHTLSHPWLTKLPASEVAVQWEQTQQRFRQWFGLTPTLGRPPYGAVDPLVQHYAAEAGLSRLVMWSATANTGPLRTWNSRPLAAGEIVLSHWDPGLDQELELALEAAHASGLTPAYLDEA